jgi:hypothetical protein
MLCLCYARSSARPIYTRLSLLLNLSMDRERRGATRHGIFSENERQAKY